VLCFATQGAHSNDAQRIQALLEPLQPRTFAFAHGSKPQSMLRLVKEIGRSQPSVVVMEGTGVAGGTAVLVANRLWGIPFVVSSGDAVGPFIALANPRLRAPATVYERLLYRRCAGFIGWTPYLVGRALTWGARRAMTAPGWSPHAPAPERRDEIRERLGIPDNAVVFGIVGSLAWNERVDYCYGAELVRAITQTDREDIRVVICGDGSGRAHLDELAADDRRVVLTGAIPRSDVPAYLAAMDVASLPQSVDGVGAFRYTTKISEYVSARVPMVTGQLPLAYDLDQGWMWRLPGDAPWDRTYIDALSALMETVSQKSVAQVGSALPASLPEFNMARQREQATAFVRDIIR
jgi:glycosyltransferase involved in cell wall biosynthesis